MVEEIAHGSGDGQGRKPASEHVAEREIDAGITADATWGERDRLSKWIGTRAVAYRKYLNRRTGTVSVFEHMVARGRGREAAAMPRSIQQRTGFFADVEIGVVAFQRQPAQGQRTGGDLDPLEARVKIRRAQLLGDSCDRPGQLICHFLD